MNGHRLDSIHARAEAATPGPWFWVGNTDSHEIHLENRRWVILGTQRIDRTPNDRDIDRIHDYLVESGIELLSDDELRDLGLDPDFNVLDFDDDDLDAAEAEAADMEAAINAAQEAHQREVAVAWHLQEDDWGQVRYDERLAMRTSGDDSGHLIPLEQQAKYNVCPTAESRDDPRVYRADYTPRSPDALFIAHAREDIDYLLAEVARLKNLLGGDDLCAICGTPIELLTNEDDEWWVHGTHPADNHDAQPSTSGDQTTYTTATTS